MKNLYTKNWWLVDWAGRLLLSLTLASLAGERPVREKSQKENVAVVNR